MKTINDLIEELQSLEPSLKKLPVVVIAPNGMEFEPVAKIHLDKNQTIFDKHKKMVITFE